MTDQTQRMHRRDDAAAYVREKHKLPCTSGYLAKLASVAGGGPPFRRLDGRWVLYAEEDLDAWALARLSRPIRKTSDATINSGAEGDHEGHGAATAVEC